MSEQFEGKYLILKDKQHESAIHWLTGVVLFGFEKLQHNKYQFAFKYVLKRVSFGSKECTKELKLECAYFIFPGPD